MTRVPATEARALVDFDDERDRFLPEGPRDVAVGARPALAWVNIQTSAEAAGGTAIRTSNPAACTNGSVESIDRSPPSTVGYSQRINSRGTGIHSRWRRRQRRTDYSNP